MTKYEHFMKNPCISCCILRDFCVFDQLTDQHLDSEKNQIKNAGKNERNRIRRLAVVRLIKKNIHTKIVTIQVSKPLSIVPNQHRTRSLMLIHTYNTGTVSNHCQAFL